MYLTLNSKKPKVEGHTTMVRYCPSPTHEVHPEVSAHPVIQSRSQPAFPTSVCKAENEKPEDKESGQKAQEPANPPHNMEWRTATPSLASECDSGASPFTHSTNSSSSSSGAPEGTNCPQGISHDENTVYTGQPNGVTLASFSSHNQGQETVL